MPKQIKSTDILGVFALTLLLLSIPLIAMKYSKVTDWQLPDFIIMGILILSAGLAILYTARKIKSANVRLAVIIAILITFLLTWGELAVGIFGTPFAGN